MKVVIAIDSFKGSMSSIEAGEAAAAFGKYIRKPRPRFIRWQMAGKGQCGHWPRDLGEAWRM